MVIQRRSGVIIGVVALLTKNFRLGVKVYLMDGREEEDSNLI